MLIPVPRKNEKESDYINRFMGDETMNKRYPESKQRSGVCYTAWRKKEFKNDDELNIDFKLECKECGLPCNDEDGTCFKCGGELKEIKSEFKLETKDIKDVEIFEAGNWKGKDYTIKDIDEAIINFDNKIIEPYLTLDHNPGLTKATQDFFKAMSLGFVSKLKRNGKKLMANFRQVPKLMAELINSGAFKQRSVEWYHKYRHANGEVYKNVLEFVTYHGGNGVPAISTLNDIPKFFKDYDANEYNKKSIEHEGEKVSIEFKQEENNMKIEIEKSEYEELLKIKANSESIKLKADKGDETVVKLKAEKEEITKERDDLKANEDKIEKMKADMETKQKVTLKAGAESYIDNLINVEKKLLPKYKDMKVEEFIRLKNDGNEDGLKLFKEELESKNPMDFDSITKNQDNTTINTGEKFKSDFEKAGDEDAYFEKADETIKAIMKRDNCSYAKASVTAGINTPEEMGLKEAE